MKNLKIVLPFPLPTWNRLLSMNQWERKKLRDWIHESIRRVVNNEKISELELKQYDALIRPKKKKMPKMHIRKRHRRF